MTNIWDDPDLAPPPETNFVKLDKVGDGFAGTVISVEKVRFEDDGSKAPQITFLDDGTGEVRQWTVGQTDAKRKCAEMRPGTGDHLVVKFVGTSGKFKHIDMAVTRQPQAAAAVQQQPAPTASLPTYRAAEPPIYATNGGNGHGGGNGVTAPSVAVAPEPAPAGVDPAVWAAMAPEQRQVISRAMAAAAVQPAF